MDKIRILTREEMDNVPNVIYCDVGWNVSGSRYRYPDERHWASCLGTTHNMPKALDGDVVILRVADSTIHLEKWMYVTIINAHHKSFELKDII